MWCKSADEQSICSCVCLLLRLLFNKNLVIFDNYFFQRSWCGGEGAEGRNQVHSQKMALLSSKSVQFLLLYILRFFLLLHLGQSLMLQKVSVFMGCSFGLLCSDMSLFPSKNNNLIQILEKHMYLICLSVRSQNQTGTTQLWKIYTSFFSSFLHVQFALRMLL